MKVKRLLADLFLVPALPTVAIVALVVLPAFWVWRSDSFWRPYGDRGEVYESQEMSNATFKVRITALYETGVYMGGAYYVFYSAPVNSNDWREFIWERVDDERPIPAGMFQFVNDHVGYVSTGAKYAVTLDGGRTWRYWEVEKELPPDWQHSYRGIKEVKVEADGTGLMFLYPFHDKETNVPKLRTKDYGQHWDVVYETPESNERSGPATRPRASKEALRSRRK